VRNKEDCERHSGRELAWKGRVNRWEPLLNVVRTNQPKARRGWSQKGAWRGVRVPPSLAVDTRPPADRRDLPQSRRRTGNVGSPHVARKGKRPVREADRRGGRGGGSKRRPLGNGADRGTCPPRKRADFPLGSHHERVGETDSGSKADDGYASSGCGFLLQGAWAADAYREGRVAKPYRVGLPAVSVRIFTVAHCTHYSGVLNLVKSVLFTGC
jgi:hypothetical protein